MTPSEEEVRAAIAWIKSLTLLHEDTVIRPAAMSYVKPSEYRRWVEARLDDVLALLDAGRKDRERLDWIDGKSLDGIHVEVWAKGNADIRVEREACVYWRNVEVKCDNVRAAIDQARGA